jgi:hypothetical protein
MKMSSSDPAVHFLFIRKGGKNMKSSLFFPGFRIPHAAQAFDQPGFIKERG